MLACKEELADVVLRLSTEDSFDLLCDLAVRHGRDLKTWGPPCACSFSRCLPCLERLVESIKTTPPTPPAEIKPIESTALLDWIKKSEFLDLVAVYDSDDEAAPPTSWADDPTWKERVSSAWEKMASILWQYADQIDPLEIPRIKGAHNALRKLNGLDLYYTVVTREVAEENTRKDLISDADSATRLYLSKHYERMKKENRKLSSKPGSGGNGVGGGGDDDWAGTEYRKALARAIREKGNQAYAAAQYQEATDQYTRAIGYDSAEPIYPLNRAACLLKLKRFTEAERDCTAAILLDATNHKAYFRRGVSRAGLGKTDEAKEDFEEVLRLQKANPQVREELRKLSERFLSESARRLNTAQGAVDGAAAEAGTDGVSAGAASDPPKPPTSAKQAGKGKGKASHAVNPKVLDVSLESTPSASPQQNGKATLEYTPADQVFDAGSGTTAPGCASAMRATSSVSSQASTSTSTSTAGGGSASSQGSVALSTPAAPAVELGNSWADRERASMSGAGHDAAGVATTTTATARQARSARDGRAGLASAAPETEASTSQSVGSKSSATGRCAPEASQPDAASAMPMPTRTEVEKLQSWLRRTREVLVEIQFAHYFGLIVERETGAKLNLLLDEDLHKCTMTVLSILVDRKKQEGHAACQTSVMGRYQGQREELAEL
ncbi:hypothetical protein ACQY0O_005965 [Thecaphora frezii]